MKVDEIFWWFRRNKAPHAQPEGSSGPSGEEGGAVATDPFDRLYRAMQVTARARFAASTRLANNDRKLMWLTSLTSAYLIILTVAPYLLHLKENHADVLNLISTGLGVVVLASSLLQYASASGVISEQHHRSALEINEIVREISISEPSSLDRSRALDRYNAVLQKYSVNHDSIDHDQVVLDRPEEFPWVKPHERFAKWVRISAQTNLPIACLILETALMILVMYAYIFPVIASHPS